MADYSSFEHLLVEVKDGIALITINRPEVLNATDARLHWALSAIWPAIDQDPDVRVAVLTGAGGPSRSAATTRCWAACPR